MASAVAFTDDWLWVGVPLLGTSGNLCGKPALCVHGGPGGVGRNAFDPDVYRIILFRPVSETPKCALIGMPKNIAVGSIVASGRT